MYVHIEHLYEVYLIQTYSVFTVVRYGFTCIYVSNTLSKTSATMSQHQNLWRFDLSENAFNDESFKLYISL